MKAKEIFNENYFPRDDNYSKADGHGDRKPHLTLSHLNRLRKIKEKKTEDTEERMKTLNDIEYNVANAIMTGKINHEVQQIVDHIIKEKAPVGILFNI